MKGKFYNGVKGEKTLPKPPAMGQMAPKILSAFSEI